MIKYTSKRAIGFQRIKCMNPACKHVLKDIEFIEGGETRLHGESILSVVDSHSARYYICPKCKAKNFVILEGENILLEKIISYELPKSERQQKGSQKHSAD